MHMRDLIAELEVSETADIGGAGVEAGAEAAAPEAVAADGVDGTPSPETAAAPAWTPDDPAFIDAVDQRAAEVANVQFQQLLQRLEAEQGSQQQQPLEMPDPNDYLNPLSDDFGTNLSQFLSQRDEYIMGQMREMFGPVQQRFQNEQLQEGQQRVADIIDDDFSRNGPIEFGDEATKAGLNPKKVIEQIAPVFLGEMESRYGQGSPRAAEQALARATGLVRQIVTFAEKRGASQNANQLATLSGANGEPATGGSAIHAGDPAGSVEEALERAFARGTA